MKSATGKKKRGRSKLILRKKKSGIIQKPDKKNLDKSDRQDSVVSSNVVKTVKELKKKKTLRESETGNSGALLSKKPKLQKLSSTESEKSTFRDFIAGGGVVGGGGSKPSLKSATQKNENSVRRNTYTKSNPEGVHQIKKKKKKFKIGAPSNYERMKNLREKMKKERERPQIYEPPDPKFAFDVMMKRSKKLKEFFFELEERQETALSYCNNNWHFMTTFESFLVEMVKEHEITKEFNQLTRKTADKIEKFIRDKVHFHFDYLENEKSLKKSLREFDKEVKRGRAFFENRLENLKGFFHDFEVDE